MDKRVRFCREVAPFGLTVALIAMLIALIWDGTLAIRVGFTSFVIGVTVISLKTCLLYTSPSPRDRQKSRMPSSA